MGIIVLLFIYLIPTLLAAYFRKRNTNAIFILNIFLGWTILGWIMALVWSFTKD